MQVGHAMHAAGGGLVASVSERAAVAELMTPSENLVGRPPRYLPRPQALLLLAAAALLSPSEPDDDE